MKKHTAVLLVVLAVLIAVALDTASATDTANTNEQYPVIDLFGEKYVPLFTTNGNTGNAHVNKLAKLILDNGTDYTLRDGEKLDLSQGYALEAKQINVDSNEVWLEFTKDGQHVADRIISVNPDSNKTWTVALDNVQGENDIVVMKVHINNLFVGAMDKIVRIDGLWLTDYANARTLKVGDKIGEFTLENIVSGANTSNLGSLVFKNTMGSSVTCNVVGTKYKCDSWANVAAGTADTINAAITMDTVSTANITNTADNLSNTTSVCDVVGTNHKWVPNEQYPVIDLFGEKYVPLFSINGNTRDVHVNKLARLIIDSIEPHTLKEGGKLDIGSGYTLQAKQIYNGKVWLEFTKDGQYVADKTFSLTDDNKTWTFDLDNVQGESNIIVMRISVNDFYKDYNDNVFDGAEITPEGNANVRMVHIDGIWLIDYANARTLKIGDKIGECTLKKIVSGTNSSNLGSLVFENTTGSAVTCNVVDTNYEFNSYKYPLINLFGEKEVPLLADHDPIWKCDVDKLARLVLDSGDKHTLKTGESLDLGQGYSLQAKQIDVDGKKVWLEFDKNGQKIDDQIISTEGDYNKWTYIRENLQGEYNIPVLKVCVSDVYQSGNDSIVQIDGIWLIDYANARTLKIGDKIGDYTLEKIVSGTNSSNLGSLAFKKTQDADFSSPTSEKDSVPTSENGSVISTNKSTGPSVSWLWDLWRFLTSKDK